MSIHTEAVETMERLKQELAASQERVKALEDALQPFAALVDKVPESGRDEYRPYIAEIGDATFTVADLRRAAALLEKS